MSGFNPVTVEHFGNSEILVFVDHASNAVPDELESLGLDKFELRRHIAWDIGARNVATIIAKRLSATLVCCEFSRLVIDVNRTLDAPDLIPPLSDLTVVPANQKLSPIERQARLENYYHPYHRRLDVEIDDLCRRHSNPFIVSVHSFTKRLRSASVDRPWQAGMLWRSDETSAKAAIEYIENNFTWRVGDNEPYDARTFNHSVDEHVGSRGLRHLTFEIRQDLIGDNEGVLAAADILEPTIAGIASRSAAA